MHLRKSILAIIIITSLVIGFAGGFGGAYYKLEGLTINTVQRKKQKK
ncbi:hypothetical protein M1M88_01310 [Peptococcaceae bacterium]|nr:hypothetical protein [Peptococcaceae bacterium]MCL0052480.1 hypothetical protein [Peptococcaceae bacterium]